jgi:precorrin-2/cobalt-factor-2 C20-methyltransferase
MPNYHINKNRKGRLYGVGVGPGDPELVTLKAARILTQVPVIFVPKKLEESTSNARSIIANLITGKQEVVELVLPMLKDKEQLTFHWQQAADNIWSHLASGKDCAFANLGDPLLYGSFIYIMDTLRQKHPELDVEIIPGVSSITAAAANALLPLAVDDDKIAILSGQYEDNFIKETLGSFNTVVFLKIHKTFTHLVEILTELNMIEKCVYVKRSNMQNQEIITDLHKLRGKKLDYFSILIVRR